MLTERVIEWTREWERKGRKEGREEGLKEGMEKGLRKGQAKGEATLLLKQIELKFGQTSSQLQKRIKGATAKQVETWGARILTATTLEEMLGE